MYMVVQVRPWIRHTVRNLVKDQSRGQRMVPGVSELIDDCIPEAVAFIDWTRALDNTMTFTGPDCW
jgi:hypothetical protein